MKDFDLGGLPIDPVQYGSQGNAVLGIRDSGKSYTATYFAERLFESDIPWVAFDPIGIWRFLRVPADRRGGKGYPVVVAGGKEGDLPLTESGAPEIVRAAMRGGVSLVIDLFDINLSKSAWRRIVKDCVLALLHENQQYGLRHVFLEEAAEFIPQKPNDWDVYNAIEKLARMGGNSRLGYTLINQRSQEVSKAILELCENIFLHRQRGKNALENLDKWLVVAGAEERKAIIQSLPDLPQGDCWAWLGGDDPQPPTRVHVPAKRSMHPDRRVMRGDIAEKARDAVDVGKFVDAMKASLTKVEADAKANDPKLLRAEIARLNREITKLQSGQPAADPQALADATAMGYAKGTADTEAAYQRILRAMQDKAKEFPLVLNEIAREMIEQEERRDKTQTVITPKGAAHSPPIRPAPRPPVSVSAPVSRLPSDIPGPLQRIVDAIRWWNEFGLPEPTAHQVAFIADYKPGSGTWNRYISDLRTRDLIEKRGILKLTSSGYALSQRPTEEPTGEALRTAVLRKIDGPLVKIMTPLLGKFPIPMSHEDCADAAGYQAGSGTWNRYVSSLRSLDLIERRGLLKAQDWLFP